MVKTLKSISYLSADLRNGKNVRFRLWEHIPKICPFNYQENFQSENKFFNSHFTGLTIGKIQWGLGVFDFLLI